MLCSDCGKFGVMHESGITIFVVNSDFFAISRCMFCDRVVEDSIDKNTSIQLFWMGVKVLNFNTGEEITDNQTLEKL